MMLDKIQIEKMQRDVFFFVGNCSKTDMIYFIEKLMLREKITIYFFALDITENKI